MFNFLAKLPKQAWIVISVAIASIAIPIGIGISALIFKSETLTYERGETRINIGNIDKAKNNSEFARKQWEQKIRELERELSKIEAPELEPIKESFEEFLPTAEAVIDSTEELEEAINLDDF